MDGATVTIGTPTPVLVATATPTVAKVTPAGQLTRRGIFGDVLAVDGGSIIIGTKWGNVTVGITANTSIKFPPGVEEIVAGDRAGIHLDKAPLAAGVGTPTPLPPTPTVAASTTTIDVPTATPSTTTVDGSVPDGGTTGTTQATDATPTIDEPTATLTPDVTVTPDDATTTADDPSTTPAEAMPTVDEPTPEPTPIVIETSFREVVALSIHVVPSKATRKHKRSVITGKCNGPPGGKGKVKTLDEEGNEEELDAVCGSGDAAEGDDVIFLDRSQGKGKPDEIRGKIDSSDIDDRIEKHKAEAGAKATPTARRCSTSSRLSAMRNAKNGSTRCPTRRRPNTRARLIPPAGRAAAAPPVAAPTRAMRAVAAPAAVARAEAAPVAAAIPAVATPAAAAGRPKTRAKASPSTH